MAQTHTPSILTVGSLAFDTVQTPFGKVDQVLGGSGNYFSVAASYYAPVKVVGIVGHDYPKSHLDWLESRQIDVSGVEISSGKTFHWAGSYDQNLNEAKTLSTALNVLEFFDPQLSEKNTEPCYLFLANLDPVVQQKVLDQIKSPYLVACDSMNFWITSKLDELKKTLKRVDILSLNETESYLLSGEKNILRAAEKIRALGPSVLIVKRGEYGAMLFTQKGIFLAPAFPLETVVDPTGAGDSFAGAFMGYLAEARADRTLMRSNPEKWEQILRRAVLAGCVMASFTVEDFSFKRIAHLSASELVARQTRLVEMIALSP